MGISLCPKPLEEIRQKQFIVYSNAFGSVDLRKNIYTAKRPKIPQTDIPSFPYLWTCPCKEMINNKNSKLVDQLFDSRVQFCWQVAKERGTTVQNRAMPQQSKIGSMASSCHFGSWVELFHIHQRSAPVFRCMSLQKGQAEGWCNSIGLYSATGSFKICFFHQATLITLHSY